MSETIERPWGSYRVLYEHPGVKIKRLTLNPGAVIPYQFHEYHEEHWEVLTGGGKALIDGVIHSMVPGNVFHIPARKSHLIRASEECQLSFMEVQVALIVPGGDAVMV